MKIGQFKDINNQLRFICKEKVTHCVPLSDRDPVLKGKKLKNCLTVVFEGGEVINVQDRDGFMKWLASDG